MRSTRHLLTGIGGLLALVLGLLALSTSPPAGAQTSDCHPDYYTCIPNTADDVDCGDIGHRVYLKNEANDAYGLDGSDDDLIGCESFDGKTLPPPTDGSGPGRSAVTTTQPPPTTAAPTTTARPAPATTAAPTTTAPTTTARPTPTTTARPAPTTTAAPRGCHPAYIDCVLMELGDRNCTSITNQIRLHDVDVDPYGLDRDNDGIGCERDGSDSANPPTTTTAKPAPSTTQPAPTTTAKPAPPTTRPAPTTTATPKPAPAPTTTAKPAAPATPSETPGPAVTAPPAPELPAPTEAAPTVAPAPKPAAPSASDATAATGSAAGSDATSASGNTRFANHLSNSREVPAVATKGLGYSVWSYDAAAKELSYRIIFRGLSDLIGAHLHMGSSTENGPVAAALDIESERARNATSTDRLIDGVITEADLAEGDMSDLIRAIQSGDIYVNMHTSDIPSGAIRGQLG